MNSGADLVKRVSEVLGGVSNWGFLAWCVLVVVGWLVWVFWRVVWVVATTILGLVLVWLGLRLFLVF
jgi:hypothetical protein